MGGGGGGEPTRRCGSFRTMVGRMLGRREGGSHASDEALRVMREATFGDMFEGTPACS